MQYQPPSKKQPSLNGSFKHNNGGSSFTSGGQPQFMKPSRVHDDTPNDTSTSSSHTNTQHKLEGLRIKIEYQGDLYAILLSKEDMNYSKFQRKLYDRFGNLDDLKYKDSNGEYVRLQDEAALNKALKFGTKLLLSLDR
jgi:hypothetical protein